MPLPDGPVRDFETRWAEERWLRDVMAGWPTPRRGKVTPENEIFIERAVTRRELIHRRLAEGFKFDGGMIGGRWREAFSETGLRSDASHVLRRIVQLTPRQSAMQVGRSKDVMWGTDAKIFGLDEPWIVLNSEVRGAFRIDLDHVFPSWEALRYEFEQLRLPCLPHVVVGFEDEEGRIERPHALFLLPYNGGVWFSDDARCRTDIMSYWRGVHAGITKTLLPLGADPGALSNSMRTKNPLSPFWSIAIWNETTFPNLTEWSDWVDTRTDRRKMIRESASMLAGADRKASNILFATFQAWTYETLKALHLAEGTDYLRAIRTGDRDALAKLLFYALVPRASESAAHPKQAQAILYRVVDYAAARWDPARCQPDQTKDRGACANEVAAVRDVSARQAVGAHYTHSLRRSRSANAVQEAIEAAHVAGEVVSVAGVARRTGLDRKTVRTNWPAGTTR